MLCDPQSGELVDRAEQLISSLPDVETPRFSFELILSEIECNTPVSETVADAMDSIIHLRQLTRDLGNNLGFRIGISGTHPTADPHQQKFVNTESYQWVAQQLQYYARRNITFGLHVHVAVPDAEAAVAATNALRRWLPPLLAISANSPFYEGYQTGLLSSRTIQFGAFPRTNVPMTFQSYAHFEKMVQDFLEMKSVLAYRGIWWKIRPHMDFGTLEFRVADVQRSIRNLELQVALSQALVYQAVQEFRSGKLQQDLPTEYIEDGLWKAARFPLDTKVTDSACGDVITMNAFVKRLGEYCAPALNHFGTENVLSQLDIIRSQGSEAHEQIRQFESGGFQQLRRFLMDTVDYSLE